MRPMRPFFVAMLLLGVTARAQEQPAPIIVHPAQAGEFPVSMGDFTNTPPDITLIPHGEGARQGQIWVRKASDGLLVVGKMDGGAPHFPKDRNEILSKDHIEIWVAGSPDVEMPEVGWADYFGENSLPNGADSCAEMYQGLPDSANPKDIERKCRNWADRQLRYRGYLKRLFVRQWLVAPGYSIESFATPAYHEILTRFGGEKAMYVNGGPSVLKPRGDVRMWMSTDQSGYSFQILVPFRALPPLSSMKLSDLYFLVDVFSPAASDEKTGAYATSSTTRVYGDPKTFNALRLDPPVNYHLTPCNLPLLGLDTREELGEKPPSHPAWFVPSTNPATSYEAEAFVLMNDIASNQPDPVELSPGIRLTHYFWNRVAPKEWVCGSPLIYLSHGHSEEFPYTVSKDGFGKKRLPGGDVLIKTGPREYTWGGQGYCGACPYTELAIFDLTKDGKIFRALALGARIDGGCPGCLTSQDFTLSPDWSQVIEYDQKYDQEADENGDPGPWSSTSYCLAVDTEEYETSFHFYKQCGQKENVQPPNPPVLKELRNP